VSEIRVSQPYSIARTLAKALVGKNKIARQRKIGPVRKIEYVATVDPYISY